MTDPESDENHQEVTWDCRHCEAEIISERVVCPKCGVARYETWFPFHSKEWAELQEQSRALGDTLADIYARPVLRLITRIQRWVDGRR